MVLVTGDSFPGTRQIFAFVLPQLVAWLERHDFFSFRLFVLSKHSPPPLQTLLVTADHSPESVREFERMRLTHPANGGASAANISSSSQLGAAFTLPSLLVVYDSPSSNKLKCSPVFDVDIRGTPTVTNKGR